MVQGAYFAQLFLLLIQNEHFCGPKRARKLMKLCSSKNLHLIWVSEVWKNVSIAPPIKCDLQ